VTETTPGQPAPDEAITKPIPAANDLDRPYWDGARQGQLMVQRCTGCGRYAHPPAMICPHCGSEDQVWEKACGRGTIHSFTIARQSTTRGFQAELPYVVVLVALEEDPDVLILTNLVGPVDLDGLDVGDPVAVTFEARGEMMVPQFELAGRHV
jgi:uncharacterized OB-fold protein